MTKKILFITSNRLGDGVLSLGLLDHLIKSYPEHTISIASGAGVAPLVEAAPNVETVHVLHKKKWAGHWIKLWSKCFLNKWDIIIDLRNSAVSRLLWANKRYIYGPHISKDQHKVEQNAQVMNLPKAPNPKLFPSDEQKKKAKEFIPDGKPVIGIGPAANWIGKTWPAENFIEILREITGKDGLLPNARIAVFGAPGEEQTCLEVLNAFAKDRQIDVIAKADPGTVAATLARCDLFIGNDSGLMHCAAAGGVPTFGLFGPSYPQWYAPWGKYTAFAQTPETFDELIDFEGYDPRTLQHTLMTSLDTETVLMMLKRFWFSLDTDFRP